MSDTQIVSARLPASLVRQLDELAGETDRSRAWVMRNAVDRYVRRELELIASIKEGEADIAAGRTYSQQEMEIWFDTQIADARLRARDKAA